MVHVVVTGVIVSLGSDAEAAFVTVCSETDAECPNHFPTPLLRFAFVEREKDMSRRGSYHGVMSFPCDSWVLRQYLAPDLS